jgi:hypothetical protein
MALGQANWPVTKLENKIDADVLPRLAADDPK